MDIKNLYTLKAIIEEGSFMGAASVLGYTQSTITFQIRQLEQECGVTLFEKIGRRMILTDAGKAMMPYVNETIEAYEKLKNIGKDYADLTGELNIILSETIFCYKMQKIISEFHRMAPNIKIKMRPLSCRITKQALIEGNADLGICYDESEDDNRLIVKSLGKFEMKAVASSELVKQLGIDALDLTKEHCTIPTSFITDEPEGLFRRNFEDYTVKHGITMSPTVELWSTDAIKSMVHAGVGIAYLPDFVVEKELQSKDFVALPHHIPYTQLRMICCHHKNKYITPQMQLLLDLLSEYY